MKFIVDKMPEVPDECPFARIELNPFSNEIWWNCNNASGRCVLGNVLGNDKECPKLKPLSDK